MPPVRKAHWQMNVEGRKQGGTMLGEKNCVQGEEICSAEVLEVIWEVVGSNSRGAETLSFCVGFAPMSCVGAASPVGASFCIQKIDDEDNAVFLPSASTGRPLVELPCLDLF